MVPAIRTFRIWATAIAVITTVSGCAQSGPPPPPPDPAAARAEREMCAELKRVLFQDSIVRSFSVYARCDGNRVTLNGTVPDYHARQRAEQIARNMPGVRFVQNNLQVNDPDEPIRY